MSVVTAEDLRIDVDGVPVCDGLTFETRAETVLVLGAHRALFDALVGLREIARGSLRVDQTSPTAAVRSGALAGAPLDPPLPRDWTPLQYVSWSARLAGQPRSLAREQARDAVMRFQLEPLASTPLARLVPHARRAVVIAAALATGARTLVLEDPLSNLPEETARMWAPVVTRALEGRSWLVFAARAMLTSPLTTNVAEAILLSSSSHTVAAQGPPGEIVAHGGRSLLARIHGAVDALRERLNAHGAQIELSGAQARIDLGASLGTADLLAFALETDVTIVELVPMTDGLF